MVRLFSAVIVTVAVVAWAMANTHQVELSFVIGAPIRIRLVFLLGTAFGTGIVFAWLLRMFARARSRRPALPPPEGS